MCYVVVTAAAIVVTLVAIVATLLFPTVALNALVALASRCGSWCCSAKANEKCSIIAV
jgi:hypothetical protein